MKTWNFDIPVERRASGAIKYDTLEERYGNASLIPLWVADMDFPTPDFIVEAMQERMSHPVFGYTAVPQQLWPTVRKWILDRHGWDVEKEWLTYIPGIVKGIGMVINVFTQPGDKVIIQPPVYHPFRLVPEGNGRRIVHNPLIKHPDGSYTMDLVHLEEIAADPQCKVLILSNPHNPAGILWDKKTLIGVAGICHRHNILVISDEIHCDMALWGKRHIPFASISSEAASCSITFQAPSKTFNIAGIVSSYAIVPNDTLRTRFFGWLEANEFNAPDIFAPIATIAAYTQGNEWRRQMLGYIEGNINFVIDYCRQHIPAIRPLRPNASFLIWLDCRNLGLGHNELIELFEKKAGLALNDGEMFGPGGKGYMRLNIGAPRQIIEQAMHALRSAVSESGKA